MVSTRILIEMLRKELILSAILKDSTGADLSSYIKNIDTKLSTALLSVILKDSTGSELSSYVKNLDVLLSSRASESTLTAIKSKTDNIDVLLSTRASESTLATIKDRLPSSLTTAGNFKTAILEDAVGLAKESTLSSIKNALASVGTDKIRVSVVDSIPTSPFNLTQISGTALTARDWSSDFAKLQNLDISLSTRASESTLAAIKSKTDNLDVLLSTRASEGTLAAVRDRLPSSLTTAGNLKTAILEDAVGLAKESTLSAIKNALASVGTDKFRTSVVDALPESPFNLTKVAGTALTGRDWSSDFAKLQNLDVLLSTRASEGTLAAIKSKTDNIDVLLSTRASESTLSAIKSKTDNLDVLLSTRASESTLSAIRDRLPSSLTTAGNLKTAILEDTVGLAKESTLQAIRDRLPTTLTASGNLKIALVETTIKQPVDIQDHLAESVALLPSGERTTSGNTVDIDVGRFAKAEVCLDVTAVSGTNPTLDVYLEGKDQTSGKYKVIWSQTGINAVGTYWLTITDLIFRYIRVRWVIGGTTPSFTFSVGLEGKS